jgi:hypothetical protein
MWIGIVIAVLAFGLIFVAWWSLGHDRTPNPYSTLATDGRDTDAQITDVREGDGEYVVLYRFSDGNRLVDARENLDAAIYDVPLPNLVVKVRYLPENSAISRLVLPRR